MFSSLPILQPSCICCNVIFASLPISKHTECPSISILSILSPSTVAPFTCIPFISTPSILSTLPPRALYPNSSTPELLCHPNSRANLGLVLSIHLPLFLYVHMKLMCYSCFTFLSVFCTFFLTAKNINEKLFSIRPKYNLMYCMEIDLGQETKILGSESR